MVRHIIYIYIYIGYYADSDDAGNEYYEEDCMFYKCYNKQNQPLDCLTSVTNGHTIFNFIEIVGTYQQSNDLFSLAAGATGDVYYDIDTNTVLQQSSFPNNYTVSLQTTSNFNDILINFSLFGLRFNQSS